MSFVLGCDIVSRVILRLLYFRHPTLLISYSGFSVLWFTIIDNHNTHKRFAVGGSWRMKKMLIALSLSLWNTIVLTVGLFLVFDLNANSVFVLDHSSVFNWAEIVENFESKATGMQNTDRVVRASQVLMSEQPI